MRRICLFIFRFILTLWLGAALFFSMVALEPIRRPEIDAHIRPQLALILFPGYYHWGLVLLAISLITGGIAVWGLAANRGRRRMQIALLCVFLASGCLLGDVKFVYSPLAKMMEAMLKTEVQPAEFRSYHVTSIALNGTMATLTLIGALLACWPGNDEVDRGDSQLAA